MAHEKLLYKTAVPSGGFHPVLLLSGAGKEGRAAGVRRSGAVFLAKPFAVATDPRMVQLTGAIISRLGAPAPLRTIPARHNAPGGLTVAEDGGGAGQPA